MATPRSDSTPPFWLRPPALTLFIAVMLGIRFVVAGGTDLVRDEAYYALWSTAPAAGYLDHPPMIAWMIAVGRAVLGDSEIAVRLFPVLSTAVIAFAIYRTGHLLLDARTAAIAVIWFTLTPANALLFLATPDALVVSFWALAVWAVAEFVARRNANWWLAAGLFAGLALLSKYTAFFLGAGLILYLVTGRERRAWFQLWQVWAGGGIAILILLPNLIWNLEAGWASFAYQGKRLAGYGTTTGSLLGNVGELIAGQALALAVLLFAFVLLGALVFFRRAELPGRANLALPIFTGLPLFLWFVGYVFQFRVEANWLLPIWPMLSLVGAWAAIHVRPSRGVMRPVLAAMRWSAAPLGAVLVAILYAQALWNVLPLQPGVDRTRDLHGWEVLQREVAALAAANGAQWIATGPDDYGLTGELAFYGRVAGSALPVRSADMPERWRFLPPLDGAVTGQQAIYVQTLAIGWPPPEHFENVELIGEARRREGEVELERFAVYLVSGPLPATRALLAGDDAGE